MTNTLVTNHSIAVLQEPTIKPLHDRLLVRRLAQQAKSGLLWIPDIAQKNSQQAEVLAIGTKVRGVNVGDRVLLPGIAAKYPDWEECDVMMIQVADIGGIFKEIRPIASDCPPHCHSAGECECPDYS